MGRGPWDGPGPPRAGRTVGALVLAALAVAGTGVRVYLAVRPDPKPEPTYLCQDATAPLAAPPVGPVGGPTTQATTPPPRVSDEPCD